MQPVSEIPVASGPFRYRAASNWAQWPAGWDVPEVAGLATDSQDRAFVFYRGEHPVAVFDSSGTFLYSWGQGLCSRPHGITIGPDDSVYLADDFDHTVRKFTPEGKLLLTLGTSGRPSDTGATSVDFRTIQQAAGPFHYPTNVAIGRSGEIFVSDGYGNARVHKFSAGGELLLSWGSPGNGPGQFHIPHGIAVDAEGLVHVADRENSRIQRFSPDGEFLGQLADVARPCELAFDRQGRMFVAELGYRVGMWPGTSPPSANATGGRVSIFGQGGEVLARFGGGERPCDAGDFLAPHDIWLDSRGAFYVAEVIRSAVGGQRPAVGDYHALQKFEPL